MTRLYASPFQSYIVLAFLALSLISNVYLSSDLLYPDGICLYSLHRLHIISHSARKKKWNIWLFVISHFFIIFNLSNTTCTASHSGQEYSVQHGNGVLPGSNALPVTAYICYIPHTFIDGNYAKAPFSVPNETNHTPRGLCTCGESFVSPRPSLMTASLHHPRLRPICPIDI